MTHTVLWLLGSSQDGLRESDRASESESESVSTSVRGKEAGGGEGKRLSMRET